MKRFALVALLATAPAGLAAQTTAELLARGIKAYEEFNVEQARPIFAQIVSPSYINPLSQEQKVLAYKYLGASWAVLAQTDSAQRYFVAALDFDPFTDLDPVKFSASELGPFGVAKTRLFRIGVRPVTPQVVNPRQDSTAYRFTIVTTHRGTARLTLLKQNDAGAQPEILFDGSNDGQKTISWNGLMRSKGGAVADSGTYLLSLTATSSNPQMGTAPATETQLVRIEQSFDPLEDSLPTLPDSMLLPEALRPSEPWLDLIKGTLVGVLAYALPVVILKSDDVLTSSGWDWKPHAIISSVVGIGSGIGSFVYRYSNRKIDANQQENQRRQLQRARYNAGIKARNDARLAQTLLIITPLTAR
jgi:hypothetical protein